MLIKLQRIDSPVAIKIADYIYLAVIIAHKFRSKNEKIEDTEEYSIACEELVKAAESYSPVINPDFSRYAFRLMRNGVISNIRRKKSQKRTANFENISDQDWQNVPASECETKLPIELLRIFLADHPDDSEQDRLDKILLSEIYLRNKKIPLIAGQAGVTRVTIYNRLKRIIGKIRQQYADLIESHGGIFDGNAERKPDYLHGGSES